MTQSTVPTLGSLSNATPGVEIVRDGQRIPAQGTVSLQPGDRVLVPDGGQAAVAFAGSAANEAPLTGVLTGGSDAVISSTTLSNGMQQVTVDLASGDLAVAPVGSAEAASLLVKKPVAAVAGAGGLGGFALGALGVGAVAAMLDDSDNDNPGNPPTTPPTTPPPPPPPPPLVPPAAVADGLLDPADGVVGDLVDAVGAPLGLGDGLAPVTDLVGGATDLVNGLLEPVVGGAFTQDNPNALDPVDNLVGSIGNNVAGVLDPVLGGLLGAGVAAGAMGAVAKQVDYLTDGVVHLVDDVVLGDVVNGLLGGTPVADLVNGLVGENGLLGTGSVVDGLTTGLLGSAGPVGGLLGEDGLLGGDLLGGDLLGGDLLGGVLGGDLLGGDLLGGDLLGGVLGGDLLGGDLLGGDLLGGVLGGGAAPAPGDILLAPANSLLGEVVETVGGVPVVGAVVGEALAPVLPLADGVTSLVSDLLAPVLGASFTANDPNLLDPVDGLAGAVAGTAGGLLSPVLDGVLGAGATSGLLAPVLAQVDYATDGVAQLLGGDLLGGGLAGGDVLGGLLGGDLLGGDLLGGDLLGGVLGGDLLGGDLLGGDLLGGGAAPAPGDILLAPANSLVGEVVETLGGVPVVGAVVGEALAPVLPLADGVTSLVSDLLAPVLGASFTANDPNLLDPVDGLAGAVAGTAGGLLSPVLDGVLGAGATSGLLAPVLAQVDYATDGVAQLLGGDLLGGGLAGGDLLGGLLGGDLLGGDLLGGDLLGGVLGGDLLGGDLLGGVLGGEAPLASGLLGGDLGGSLLGDGGLLGGITTPLTSLVPMQGGEGAAAPVTGLLHGLLG